MIDLNDSEIIALEKGPLAFMQAQQGKHKDLESFRRAAIHAFNEVGFQVTINVYETNQEGCYAFEPVVTGRVPGSKGFDPDRQVHEVVNNILELPDQQEGFIKTDRRMLEDLAAGNTSGPKHRH